MVFLGFNYFHFTQRNFVLIKYEKGQFCTKNVLKGQHFYIFQYIENLAKYIYCQGIIFGDEFLCITFSVE